MKLSRQLRRSLCRQMAKNALRAMPLQEARTEHRKSVKLLARRMYAEVPENVADGTILDAEGNSTLGVAIGGRK
jgi:hypothetical protein